MEMKSWRISGVIASVMLMCVCVFSPCFSGQFLNWDDDEYVVARWEISSGLNSDGIRWAFTTFAAANWHPLVWMSYMSDISLFGKSAEAMHAVNLLLHLANVALVTILFYRLTLNTTTSIAIAALFAVHPQHVEVVAWISERKELLCTCFGLLSMCCWSCFRSSGNRFAYFLSLLLFSFSLMSKQMLVTMPGLLVILDLVPIDGTIANLRRASLIRSIWRHSPYFGLSAAACVVVLAAQSAGGAIASTQVLPIWVRLLNATQSVCFYLLQSVIPLKLSPFYCHPGAEISITVSALCGGWLLGIMWLIAKCCSRATVFVGLYWFTLTLIPVLGFVHVGAAARADRYMYFSHLGLFLAVLSTPILARKNLRELVHVGFATAFLCLSIISFKECQKWHDSMSLWESAIAIDSDNYRALGNLTSALLIDGHPVEAIATGRKALACPENMANGEVHLSIGTAAMQIGMTNLAESMLRRATKLSPENAIAHTNLGCVLRAQYPQEARFHFEKAVELDQYNIECIANLANHNARDGNVPLAIVLYRRAIKIAPHDERLKQNLSILQGL